MIRNVQGQTHIKDNFNFVQGHSLTHYDRQSDIVDYRAAYFAAKNKGQDIAIQAKITACIQAHETACKFMKLHASSRNLM